MSKKATEALAQQVDEAILKVPTKVRDYMGTSGLGAECDRQLWYSFHQPKPVDNAKTLRIFGVGHALEPVIINYLRQAGLEVWTEDAEGNQFGFTDEMIAGHIDGVVKGVPHFEKIPFLLEIKTANNFRFKEFVKYGLAYDEKYKIQVQVYMHKMKLKKCLAVILNKDTQELCYDIIDYDEYEAVTAIQRGKAIAVMDEVPDRKYATKSFFKCQYCNWKPECWSKE